MKTASLLCLATLTALQVHAQTPTPAPFGNVVQGYTLDWSDEFTGTTLDADKWVYREDDKGWSTQQAANVSVANGHLEIAVKAEQTAKHKYTGGGIISQRAFEYGYYEARFKVPPGSGWHTSFWTMDYNAKNTAPLGTQEIDICEQDSVKTTSYSKGVIAWDQKGKNYGRTYTKTPDLAADFHVWGCEYTPTIVRFFFDGKLVGQADATKFKHGPQRIWLTAISIGYGGTTYVDIKKLPSAAEFDYVRFYKVPTTAQ